MGDTQRKRQRQEYAAHCENILLVWPDNLLLVSAKIRSLDSELLRTFLLLPLISELVPTKSDVLIR